MVSLRRRHATTNLMHVKPVAQSHPEVSSTTPSRINRAITCCASPYAPFLHLGRRSVNISPVHFVCSLPKRELNKEKCYYHAGIGLYYSSSRAQASSRIHFSARRLASASFPRMAVSVILSHRGLHSRMASISNGPS